MRSMLWKAERSVRLLLPLVLCAAGAAAQEKPLPASGQPPEVQQARSLSRPLGTVAPQSVDQILHRLGVTRAEIERRKVSARAAALPATAMEPAEVVEAKRLVREQPARAHSASVKEILDALRRQPGGAAMIERARRAGARIPRETALNGDYDNPHKAVFYFATREGLAPDAIQPTPTLRVTRTATSQSITGFGSLNATAYFPWYINSATTWGPLLRSQLTSTASSPVGAAYDVKPYMGISFYASSAGWYAINVTAGQSGFEARHYTAGTYQLLTSFPKPATAGSNPYPVLVNLAAGSHWFTWANLDYVWVSEVSVIKF